MLTPGENLHIFTFKWHLNSGLIWYGNKTEPPSGLPACGWMNELCPSVDKESDTTLAIWVSVTVVVVTLAFTVTAAILISRRK